MIDHDLVKLLHGPYRTPRLRVGDRAFCLLRDCEIVITSITDARIPWPRCRAVEGTGGGSGLWLGGDLAKAVKRESAAAVMHWWRLSKTAVWHMRKGMDVTRTNNEGTKRLLRRTAEFAAEAMREREWTEAERQQRREQAERLDLERHLREGYHKAHGWKAHELRLLGKRSDTSVAAKTGRSVDAVRQKRQELGIPNPQPHEWTPDELALLDKYPDGVVAARTGRTAWAVYLKRKEVRRWRRRQ
jgi:hypothetical protein